MLDALHASGQPTSENPFKGVSRRSFIAISSVLIGTGIAEVVIGKLMEQEKPLTAEQAELMRKMDGPKRFYAALGEEFSITFNPEFWKTIHELISKPPTRALAYTGTSERGNRENFRYFMRPPQRDADIRLSQINGPAGSVISRYLSCYVTETNVFRPLFDSGDNTIAVSKLIPVGQALFGKTLDWQLRMDNQAIIAKTTEEGLVIERSLTNQGLVEIKRGEVTSDMTYEDTTPQNFPLTPF